MAFQASALSAAENNCSIMKLPHCRRQTVGYLHILFFKLSFNIFMFYLPFSVMFVVAVDESVLWDECTDKISKFWEKSTVLWTETLDWIVRLRLYHQYYHIIYSRIQKSCFLKPNRAGFGGFCWILVLLGLLLAFGWDLLDAVT